MYYRIMGQPVIEDYKEESLDKDSDKNSNVFPLWALIIIIDIISGIGLWFLFNLRKNNRGQNFGFQFY